MGKNIYFECSKCGDTLAATPDMAGTSTDCPKCGASVEVPMKSTVAPPPGGVNMGGALAQNKRAVVMVVILFVILFVYIGKMLKKEEPEPEAKSQKPAVTNAEPVVAKEESAPAPAPAPAPEEAPKPIIKSGDTREMVMEALGKPLKTSKFGDTEILVYNEFELELTDGRVTGKKAK